MKKVFFAIIFILATTTVGAQTPLYFAWDYDDALIGDISHFRVSYDGGQFNSVGLPNPYVDSSTTPGSHSYKTPLPTLAAGANHTASVVACSDTMGCSFEAAIPFKLVGPAKNPRIVK